MKSVTAVVSIALLALLFAGCGAAPAKENGQASSAAEDRSSPEQARIETQPGREAAPKSPTNTGTESQTSGNETPDIGIVAESGNAVSSAEKEEVLSSLDKELDALLSGINSSEEVRDEDLQNK